MKNLKGQTAFERLSTIQKNYKTFKKLEKLKKLIK
jgi:hypothetical protein